MVEETADSAGISLPRERKALSRAVVALEMPEPALRVVVWLGVAIVASTALRLLLAWQTAAPWIVPDEPTYAALARSFAETGHFAVAGHGFSPWSFGPLYPILVAPVYVFSGSLTHAYLIVKSINCVLMSLSIVPAYLLARHLLERKMAVLFACLAALVPSGIYTTKVMTESLAYPLFLFAAFASFRLLQSPSRRREVIHLAAVGLAALARGQLIVLLPAFACAAVLVGVCDHREGTGRSFSRFLKIQLRAYPLTWALLVAGLLAAVTLTLLGVSLSTVSDGHGPAVAGVSPLRLVESFVLHIALLDLYVGLIPFAALATVTWLSVRRGTPREQRIICALTVSVACWLALAAAKYLVAAYPGSFLRIYDRYLFYAVPLVLVVFLGWVRDGLPRPRGIGIIAAGAALLPALIPYSHVLSGGEWGVSSSSVALLPWANLRFLVGSPYAVYPVLAAGGIFLAAAFLRSRDRDWLVFLVAANVVVLNAFALWGNSSVAATALREGIGSKSDRSWIDSAVGPDSDVAVLWSGFEQAGQPAKYGIWESEFFNRSVRHFYYAREPLYIGGFAGRRLALEHSAFYLADRTPLRVSYVLTDAKTVLAGRRISANDAGTMVLYRIDGPVRLR